MTNAQTEPTPEHTGPWRVVLVDDHGIFRAGVRHELEQASDKVEIVGEGEDVATGESHPRHGARCGAAGRSPARWWRRGGHQEGARHPAEGEVLGTGRSATPPRTSSASSGPAPALRTEIDQVHGHPDRLDRTGGHQ